jgi:hypothetical protein
MAELIPLTGGALAGLVLARYATGRVRVLVLALVSVVLALVAGIVSGELEESGLFLVWDSLQAFVAGALVVTAAVRLRRTA